MTNQTAVFVTTIFIGIVPYGIMHALDGVLKIDLTPV